MNFSNYISARFILAAILFVSTHSWAAPACLETQGGMGGTGSPIAAGGIGGTGLPVAKGGIGGTGIVGTITGFGSVCVNGLEVDYTQQTPVLINGRRAGVSDLAIGQVISMVAETGSNGLQARSIEIMNVLEGPVSQAPQDNEIRIMGQRVYLSPAAATRIDLSTLQPDTKVQVSGYRDAHGDVYATHIEISPQLTEASVIGTFEKPAVGNAHVHGLNIADTAGKVAMLVPNVEVLLTGQWDGKALKVSSGLPDPVTHSFVASQDVVLEGLIQNVQADHAQLKVNGLDVDIGSQTSIAGGNGLEKNQIVRISGQMDMNHHLRADRIEIEHPEFERSNREVQVHQGNRHERDAVKEKSSAGADRQESPAPSDKADPRDAVPDNVKRIESVERPNRIERPDTVQKPERPERIQRPERIERPD